MSSTKIEWTHPPGYRGVTLNPVVGCRPISAGCLNCYAATMAGQRLQHMPQSKAKYSGLTVLNNGRHAFNGVLRLDRDAALKPLSWREPRCIFACSMGDIFAGSDSDQKAGADEVPFEFLDLVFAVAALTPQHRYLLLTKRPDRAAEYLNGPDRALRIVRESRRLGEHIIRCGARSKTPTYARVKSVLRGSPDEHGIHQWRMPWPLPNVAIGCSVSTQADADRDIPHLLACPAAMRFVSYEPALERVDFEGEDGDWLHPHPLPRGGGWDEEDDDLDDPDRSLWENQHDDRDARCSICLPDEPWMNPIDWIIVGGESGPNARPFDLAWARYAVKQARAAGVACFVKQIGAHPTLDGVEITGVRDSHGGDPAEWPEDLRVREWPSEFFAQEGTGHGARGTRGEA